MDFTNGEDASEVIEISNDIGLVTIIDYLRTKSQDGQLFLKVLPREAAED